MTTKPFPIALFVVSILLAASGEAVAQYAETIMNTDWRERHAPDAGLTAHDFNLLGDSIDLASGGLTFEQVDVSLPGNSHLPVEFRRRMNPGQMMSRDMWNWHHAVPTISTKIHTEEWYSNNRWGKTRCTTSNLATAIPDASWPTQYNNPALMPSEYNDGVNLDIPGRVSTQVLDKTVSDGWPATAEKVTAVNWYLECIADIDGQGTEGFVAVAPNGDRYTFDVILPAGSARAEFEMWTENSNPWYPPHYKKQYVFYDALGVSQITDVDGNWVQYDYDPATGRLIGIEANDGRKITIDRGTGGIQVSSVIANPGTADERVWTYTYTIQSVYMYKPPTQFNGQSGYTTKYYRTLTEVTLPDDRNWEYGLVNLFARAVPGTCTQLNKNLTVTHPDGVTGTFNMKEIKVRLGKLTPGGAPWCPNTNHGSHGSSEWSDVISVWKKTLSSPSIESSVWEYSFVDLYSQGLTETTVTRPDDSTRVVYHPYPFSGAQPNVHTRMTEEQIYAPSAGPLMETRTYTYLQEAAAGSSFVNLATTLTSYRPVRSDEVTITRGSDWYKTQNTYDLDRTSATYSYGYPTGVDKWSSLGSGTRDDDIVYAHDTANWILGLPSTVTKNTKPFDEYIYGIPGHVTEHKRFGDPWRTYQYYTTGTAAGLPEWVEDPLGRRTTFRYWKRGTPEEVERADTEKLLRTVNDNGWVTSITDWNGNVFGYDYDLDSGRLTDINRPAPWTDTTIAYTAPSGGITQHVITRGDYVVTTDFDALLRPVKVVAEDTNVGGDSIYTYTEFDAMGRVALESLPYGTDQANPDGVATLNDALGRKTQVTETAAGGGITSYAYLPANKTQITDPESNVTVNTFSAYGSPDDGDKIKTESPEGVTVDYGFDPYGNLLSVSQAKSGGGTHDSFFYYDYRLLLCRRSIPETGDTVYFHDAAHQQKDYAGGLTAGTSCLAPPYANGVSLDYDLAGRLTTTDYSYTTPDISRTYDPNGNVLTVNRGGANWTYTYNELDLVETESLAIDGRTYLVDPTYDGNERLLQKTYPSGTVYSYAPDAHGRAGQIVAGATTYLSGIGYHPNGKIESLSRGSGGTFSQTLNARQLVASIGGNWGDTFSYGHDLNGRIESITAAIDSAYDRVFTYDGVGRLKMATGPWDAGVYTYDTLGNLELKTLGARTVNPEYDSATNRLASVNDSEEIGGPRSYSHDNRGNVTGDGNHGFTYDLANQPVTMTGADSGSFSYDGNLKRVKQIINGETIYSVYDASGAVITRDNVTTSEETDYLSLAGQTFVRIKNGTASYPLNDHLGTAFMVTDLNGNVLSGQNFNYTPFGETWPYAGNDPGNANEQGYTGHIEDETGLTYMQARYYDPVIGRFLQTDPIGYEDQLSLYAYVGNDPVNSVDLYGQESYWVARPSMGGQQHSFILQTSVNQDGQHTITGRATFGSEGSMGGGRMVNKTNSGASVDLTDQVYAEKVAAVLSNPKNTVMPKGTIVEQINAPDDIVESVADSVEGSSNYQVLPEQMPGPGTNSNTAPAAIAKQAAEQAGNQFEIPAGAKVPGTAPETIEQLEYDE